MFRWIGSYTQMLITLVLIGFVVVFTGACEKHETSPDTTGSSGDVSATEIISEDPVWILEGQVTVGYGKVGLTRTWKVIDLTKVQAISFRPDYHDISFTLDNGTVETQSCMSHQFDAIKKAWLDTLRISD